MVNIHKIVSGSLQIETVMKIGNNSIQQWGQPIVINTEEHLSTQITITIK